MLTFGPFHAFTHFCVFAGVLRKKQDSCHPFKKIRHVSHSCCKCFSQEQTYLFDFSMPFYSHTQTSYKTFCFFWKYFYIPFLCSLKWKPNILFRTVIFQTFWSICSILPDYQSCLWFRTKANNSPLKYVRVFHATAHAFSPLLNLEKWSPCAWPVWCSSCRRTNVLNIWLYDIEAASHWRR